MFNGGSATRTDKWNDLADDPRLDGGNPTSTSLDSLSSTTQTQASRSGGGTGTGTTTRRVGSRRDQLVRCQAAAAAKGGYLATLTSAPENDFVLQMVNDAGMWHAQVTAGYFTGPCSAAPRPQEA